MSDPATLPPARPYAAWFVWGVWAVMVAGTLVYVAVHTFNVPLGDDWDMVPYVTGHQPVTWDWLWGLHGEHRLVLPKLTLVALFGPLEDFRAGMYFNVAGLAGLAAALIVTARRLRGWTDYPDAVVPLALLNPGHFWTTLWSLQVVFVLPTLLAGIVFLILARRGCRLTWSTALAAGLCTILLPLCGGPGLTYAPALVLWLLVSAVLTARAPGGYLTALVGLATAAIAVGVVLLYVGRSPLLGSSGETPPDLLTNLKGAATYLAISLGPLVAWGWPAAVYVVPAILAATLGALVWGWVARRSARGQLFALFLFAGVFGALVLALGRGRTGAGFELADMFKYVTVLVPVLYWTYFVWVVAVPGPVARVAQWGLLALLIATLVPNTAAALEYGQRRRERTAAFLDDLYAGVEPFRLVKRHSVYLYPYANPTQSCASDFLDWFPILKNHQIGAFGHLADDPAFVEERLPLKPSSQHDLTWEAGTARITGASPELVFTLPRSRHVAGVRIEYTDAALRQGQRLHVRTSWKDAGETDYAEQNYYDHDPLDASILDQAILFWIDERVKSLRLELDPGMEEVQVRKITLYLLPPRR